MIVHWFGEVNTGISSSTQHLQSRAESNECLCAPLLTCLCSVRFLYSHTVPLPGEWCYQQWPGSSHISQLKSTSSPAPQKWPQNNRQSLAEVSLQVILDCVELTKLTTTDTNLIDQSSPLMTCLLPVMSNLVELTGFRIT